MMCFRLFFLIMLFDSVCIHICSRIIKWCDIFWYTSSFLQMLCCCGWWTLTTSWRKNNVNSITKFQDSFLGWDNSATQAWKLILAMNRFSRQIDMWQSGFRRPGGWLGRSKSSLRNGYVDSETTLVGLNQWKCWRSWFWAWDNYSSSINQIVQEEDEFAVFRHL